MMGVEMIIRQHHKKTNRCNNFDGKQHGVQYEGIYIGGNYV